ncbi:MAG TPA: 2-dehydropantoate 2-reductase [Candidatus Kapabacteria bacterium]|nr:2-dehydropantoate 2-reductase [Candidatus Kapabacteria bacterium]
MTPSLSHWHILGAGAIGGLWALRLQAIGCNVTLLEAVLSSPLRQLCLKADGANHCHAFPVSMVAQSPLLVTTKAGDTIDALRPVLDSLPSGSSLVLLQNGMGVDDLIRQQRPDLRIITGITTDGVFRENRNQLVLAGQGITLLGGETPAEQDIANDIAQQWSRTGATVSAATDIRIRRWQKLAINCAINPLTARYRCRNGELLDKPEALATMQAICHEVAAVMHAEGMAADGDDLFGKAKEVAFQTGANTSSMLADVQAGRRTEIDFMNGYIVHLASRHGLTVPANKAITAAIRLLSQTPSA